MVLVLQLQVHILKYSLNILILVLITEKIQQDTGTQYFLYRDLQQNYQVKRKTN